MKLAAVVVAALAAFVIQYFVLLRPWYQTWGATAAEAVRSLPGDELLPRPVESETRAITIGAPPQAVWPWLAQLGQDRGGLYSYEWLEDLAGAEMPNATRLLGLPDPRVGDPFWMYTRHKANGLGYAVYDRVEPGRALVLRPHGRPTPGLLGEMLPHGSWAFVLEPRHDGRTRLLVRCRYGDAAAPPSLFRRAYHAIVFDPIHFAMERKTMVTLRDRAEGRRPAPPWVDVAEIVLWGATLAFGLASLAALALRPTTLWRPLAAGTIALFVLTLLFFARPPLAIAVVLVACLRWVLAWAWRGDAHDRVARSAV